MVKLVDIKNRRELAAYLRSYYRRSGNQSLTQVDLDYLADWIDGKIKGKHGRPDRGNLYFFTPLFMATNCAECYLAA